MLAGRFRTPVIFPSVHYFVHCLHYAGNFYYCRNTLAKSTVYEFLDSRSLYLQTLLLCNILATFRPDNLPTYKRCLLVPYSKQRTEHLE